MTLRLSADRPTPRCPRCDTRIGTIRYLLDDHRVTYDSDGEWDGVERILETRGAAARGYERVLVLPVGWEPDANGNWDLRPNRAKDLEAGRAPIRGQLPKMPGEPLIERIKDAGFVVSSGEIVLCSKCHAPLEVAGVSRQDTAYLVRLRD